MRLRAQSKSFAEHNWLATCETAGWVTWATALGGDLRNADSLVCCFADYQSAGRAMVRDAGTQSERLSSNTPYAGWQPLTTGWQPALRECGAAHLRKEDSLVYQSLSQSSRAATVFGARLYAKHQDGCDLQFPIFNHRSSVEAH